MTATPDLAIVMLAYPDMTQLDLTAPFEVFSRLPGAKVEIAWKNTKPVADSSGLKIVPTVKLSKVARCDLLFVPGGPGQLTLMDDRDVLDFLAEQAARARHVTSVCTGSLVLAAAGLLKGYRATSHWLSLDQLALMGAIPVAERVVVDRNRVTGAGVTSGLDFALRLAAEIAGAEEARRIGLAIEYEPEPPFPRRDVEDPALIDAVRQRTAAFQRRREDAAKAAGLRIGALKDQPAS